MKPIAYIVPLVFVLGSILLLQYVGYWDALGGISMGTRRGVGIGMYMAGPHMLIGGLACVMIPWLDR